MAADIAEGRFLGHLVFTLGADLLILDSGKLSYDDGELLLELGDLLNHLSDILGKIDILSGSLVGELAKLDELFADIALDSLSGDPVLGSVIDHGSLLR